MDYKRLLFRDGNFVGRQVDRCSVATFNSVRDDFLVQLPFVNLAFAGQNTDVLTRLRVVNKTFGVTGIRLDVRSAATQRQERDE